MLGLGGIWCDLVLLAAWFRLSGYRFAVGLTCFVMLGSSLIVLGIVLHFVLVYGCYLLFRFELLGVSLLVSLVLAGLLVGCCTCGFWCVCLAFCL